MAKFLATVKAILTRLVFGAHGFIAIWQVTNFKKNQLYWYLSTPMLLLFFEGIFTLTIKESQEWKWFCPSVFLYLSSVVPAIWLLELDKVDKRLRVREETFNISTTTDLKELHRLLGVQIKLPEINLNTETWVTLIEQFLMLTLIIGRWMLPKGDLTRDQLSQLLLVYIGTAADIIEFFDSFKDETIAAEPLLVTLTLAIWSWSLLQFTVVLTATKSRKSRLSSNGAVVKSANCCCCNIDVWGIALNIVLQDAPFLAFRLLIITHYNIISYMNVFFTCKNTLVILLQLYRLYVVYSENHKSKKKTNKKDFELSTISIISKPNINNYDNPLVQKYRKNKRSAVSNKPKPIKHYIVDSDKSSETERAPVHRYQHNRNARDFKNTRKDTGYSTASSQTSCTQTPRSFAKDLSPTRTKSRPSDPETYDRTPKNRTKFVKPQMEIDIFSEESENSLNTVTFSDSEGVCAKRREQKRSFNRESKLKKIVSNSIQSAKLSKLEKHSSHRKVSTSSSD